LALITFALFVPSLRHDFLKYDDQQYVTENPHVLSGLTWSGFLWAFKTFHASNWHPLTWLSHQLDCQLYGLHPAGHHLTNVLFHTANVVLLFLLLRRMTGAVWRSAFVAGLFVWHPLHIESVAWVAERKDVLSAFFFFLTLCSYVRYAEARGAGPEIRSPRFEVRGSGLPAPVIYLSALVFFALGLMSKPMVVTLPFVLLLLDCWPLNRFQPSSQNSEFKAFLPLLLEKLPFLLMSAIGCGLTLAAQQTAMVSTAGLRVSQRLEHSLLAYVHYVSALLAPRGMSIYYPYEKSVSTAVVLSAGLVLAGITILIFWFSGRRRYLVTGWLWFLGMLVPVLGLVQVGEQAWADRYTYLPSIGLFIILAWGFGDLMRLEWPGRAVLPWLAGASTAGLLALTSFQLRFWKDTRSVFEHSAQVTRKNPLAATVLGSLSAEEGKYGEAVACYRNALSYSPGFPEAHFYLGNAFDHQGDLDAAIAEYQKAIWYKPIQAQTHIRLGVAMAKQQKVAEAAAHYEAALKTNPESAIAHNNLAKLLHSQGRLEEAIRHYSDALKFDPSLAQAHNNLGILFLQKGRVAEGVAQIREALRLQPGDPESQLNLAQGLVDQQQWKEAADLFAKTVTPATADPNVHFRFATALAHVQRTREAMSHYASALLLQPDFPAALDGLSWLLATDPNPQFRNGVEAIRMAERACELTARKDPAKLKTLAATYAEAGRFPEAVAAVQEGLALAEASGHKELADQCRLMRENFQAGKAWREPR
jgi:tetratricopeptide (TPR) repeat protein